MHIFLHFLVPAVVTWLFFRKDWKKAYMVMMLTMIVDMDHLLADPIYDPTRCSIGFHPLHKALPIAFYGAICFVSRLRYVGLGLIIHMVLDSIDCQMTNGVWWCC